MKNEYVGPIALVVAVMVLGTLVYMWQERAKVVGPGGAAAGANQTSSEIPGTATGTAGPDVKVGKGTSLDSYVSTYYAYVKASNWSKAYAMQPASNKSTQTLESFTQSHTSMPLKSFEVGKPVVKGNTATVDAVQTLGGDAAGMKWTTIWTFTKKGKDWTAAGTKSVLK